MILNSKQKQVLKLFKYKSDARRKLIAHLFLLIREEFHNQFYQAELIKQGDMLSMLKDDESLKLNLEFFKEYGVSSKETLTDERIAVISQDKAELVVDDLTKAFIRRPLESHIQKALNEPHHKITYDFLEALLGVDKVTREDCKVILDFYTNELTETFDATVGF